METQENSENLDLRSGHVDADQVLAVNAQKVGDRTGHSFVVADDEFRLVTLDDILVALPPSLGATEAQMMGRAFAGLQ